MGCHGFNERGAQSMLIRFLLFPFRAKCAYCRVFFRITLPELNPNPGLWWYFFTEMFDHFRPFFLVTFSVSLLFRYIRFPFELNSHLPDAPSDLRHTDMR